MITRLFVSNKLINDKKMTLDGDAEQVLREDGQGKETEEGRGGC